MDPKITLHLFMVLFLFIFQFCDYKLTLKLLQKTNPPVWSITDKLYIKYGDLSILARYSLSAISFSSFMIYPGNLYYIITLFVLNGLIGYMVINKYDFIIQRKE